MVSEFLKKNTADLHDAAEKLFGSDKIFNKTFSVNDYKKIICRNYLMLLNAEPQIFETLRTDFSEKLDLEKRKKLPFIEEDIKNLNIRQQQPLQSLKILNADEALGMLYVIEGSTLGGHVIAKHLLQTPGFEEISFDFFGCYGQNTGIMWRKFKEVLDSEIQKEAYGEVLSGAKKIYHLLLNLN